MHPRTQELLDYLDEQRQTLRDAVSSIPAEQLAVPPAADRWSTLGVLEHLAMVERGITSLLQKTLDEARAAGLGNETDASPLLPTLNLDRILNRGQKITASERIHPKNVYDLDTLWRMLAESREALRKLVLSADGLALREIKQPHPVFGPFDGYEWFTFIAAHEARHAAQIREIGASLGGVA